MAENFVSCTGTDLCYPYWYISTISKQEFDSFDLLSKQGESFMIRYLMTLIMCFCLSLCAEEIIHIASSNHPLATACNNSRKLVRTIDDRLVVVYQDSIQAQSVIMWLYSDGLNWSEPKQLAPGSFPALTIAENNQIYAAWQLEEQNGIGLAVFNQGETEWHYDLPQSTIIPASAGECRFPSIEVTESTLYVAWQQRAREKELQQVWLQRLDRKLEEQLSPAERMSDAEIHATMPVLCGDLEFSNDLIHLFWTAWPDNDPRIRYRSVKDDLRGSHFTGAVIELPFRDCMNLSCSARNWSGWESSLFLAMYNNRDTSVQTFFMHMDSALFDIVGADTIVTDKMAFPSVDDVVRESVAMVWHNGTDILYGQNTEGEFLRPPVPISEKGAIPKSNPSIGYKMFRWDLFDVIWTEGDRPPYKIIYKRHKKDYNLKVSGSPVPVVRSFELEQNYPNPFNHATSISLVIFQAQMLKAEIYDLQGRLCKTLAAKHFTEGGHTLSWDGTDNRGLPVSSGFYVLSLKSDNETNKIKLLCLK
ncbi:T9SS type A sorting domain-containing protein [candidate division KSB1 bacterium]|nr:T9SS type A sorting domain-containing protein [candidate division KSB1 bacterium]